MAVEIFSSQNLKSCSQTCFRPSLAHFKVDLPILIKDIDILQNQNDSNEI